MLRIPQDIVDAIIGQAREGLPEEVCGYLAGSGDEVIRWFPLTNIDHSPEHFSFDPAEQFQVLRQTRKEGLEILANYHSHPETPARPSIEDIKLAYDPKISYVILSLVADSPVIKSFKINDGKVTNEKIEIFDLFPPYRTGSVS
jgi:proteasome lid subunit RPN8/RPN11